MIALAVIFAMMSFAAAEEFPITLIQEKKATPHTVEFAHTSIVYEIVLIPHPCDPDSNLLFAPDDPIVQCAGDKELEQYINEIAIEVIGFPISLDDLLIPEVTNLNDLEQQITQLDTTSQLIFEYEAKDLAESTEEQVIEQYQEIKDIWNNEINELENDAISIFKDSPGVESKIIQQKIEKLKLEFDLKEEKIKNTILVQKKIKTSIELKSLKEEFQDSMNEYAVTEKAMKYGDEKDKKLEQLYKQNIKLMKKMLIVEAKHNDKKLEFDDFKKIDDKVTEKINSVSYNSEQSGIFGSGDANNGNYSENDSSGSESGKGSDNKGKSSDSKGKDNKGKGLDSKGKGKSKK